MKRILELGILLAVGMLLVNNPAFSVLAAEEEYSDSGEEEGRAGLENWNMSFVFTPVVSEFTAGDARFTSGGVVAKAKYNSPGKGSNFHLVQEGAYLSHNGKRVEQTSGFEHISVECDELEGELIIKADKMAEPGSYTAYVMGDISYVDDDNYEIWGEYSFEVKTGTAYTSVLTKDGKDYAYVGAMREADVKIPLQTVAYDCYGEEICKEQASYKIREGIYGSDYNEHDEYEGIHFEDGSVVIPKDYQGDADLVIASYAGEERLESANTLGLYVFNRVTDVDYLTAKDWETDLRISQGAVKRIAMADLDEMTLVARDSEGREIPAMMTAEGKSIRLSDNGYGRYTVSAVGTGVSTIKVTPLCGGKAVEFSVNICTSLYEAERMCLYYSTDVESYSAGEYSGDFTVLPAELMNYRYPVLNVRASDYDNGHLLTPATGGFSLLVKGGTYNPATGDLMPTGAKTVLTLKSGKQTLQKCVIINTMFAGKMPNSKGISHTLFSEYVEESNVRIDTKGSLNGGRNIAVAADASYAKMNKQRRLTSDILADYIRGCSIMGDNLCFVVAKSVHLEPGKYTFMCMPYDTVSYSVYAKSKPFKLTIKVTNKVPSPSIKLYSKKIGLAGSKGSNVLVRIKSMKNVGEVTGARLLNRKSGTGFTDFTSYCSVVGNPAREVTDSSYLRIKTNDLTGMGADLKGYIRFDVKRMDGSSTFVDVPVSAFYRK